MCIRDSRGGRLHHRNHPLVGHPGRPDHPQHAHHLAIAAIGGRHQGHVLQRGKAGLLADENLHALCVQGALEHLQDVALVGEGLEQVAQALDVADRLRAHQPGLPGDQQRIAALAWRCLLYTSRCV